VILFRTQIDNGLAQDNPLIVVTAQRGVKVAPQAMFADRPTLFWPYTKAMRTKKQSLYL
jgi:hypothetical protein